MKDGCGLKNCLGCSLLIDDKCTMTKKTDEEKQDLADFNRKFRTMGRRQRQEHRQEYADTRETWQR